MQGNPTRIKSSREQARRLVKIAQPRGQKICLCSATVARRRNHILSSSPRTRDPYGAESRYGNEVDAFFSD
jgi:hypothetical protein